jgi:hypothetical protein
MPASQQLSNLLPAQPIVTGEPIALPLNEMATRQDATAFENSHLSRKGGWTGIGIASKATVFPVSTYGADLRL